MIYPIPAFEDNYIWILINNDSSCAWVVDPGDASPVINYLEKHTLKLKGILLTHHHKDHTGGVKQLHSKYDCIVAGPAHLKDIITQDLYDNDSITIFDSKFQVVATPGHTLDHLCYYSNDWQGQKILLSGDTLFRGGCGRLFEGTPQKMYESLKKLAAFPADTSIYCTHEYTLANYRFALKLEPNNQILQKNYQIALQLREKNEPTLPSKMHIEQETNPFLRSDTTEFYRNATQHLALNPSNDAIERFTQIRQAKDIF